MSGGGLVELFDEHEITEVGGGTATGAFWRCKCGATDFDARRWPLREQASWAGRQHLADVVTAHLAARLEGCREEVATRMFRWNTGIDPYFVIRGRDGEIIEGDPYQPIADAALAIVRGALGLEPPSDALGGASDGRTGRDGTSMQGERVGDGA